VKTFHMNERVARELIRAFQQHPSFYHLRLCPITLISCKTTILEYTPWNTSAMMFFCEKSQGGRDPLRPQNTPLMAD